MCTFYGDYSKNLRELTIDTSHTGLPNTIVFNNHEYKLERPKEVHLTEFQKLIVNCKPEINKPVFVLCGAGSGKTFALNERSKKVNFLYYHPSVQCYKRTSEYFNLKMGNSVSGWEEVVFEHAYAPELILSLVSSKKIIVFTNGVDFVKNFATKLKGEYTIISGFSVRDNPYLNNPAYEECLNSLRSDARKRYFDGGF